LIYFVLNISAPEATLNTKKFTETFNKALHESNLKQAKNKKCSNYNVIHSFRFREVCAFTVEVAAGTMAEQVQVH
jgi:hypothetical protein